MFALSAFLCLFLQLPLAINGGTFFHIVHSHRLKVRRHLLVPPFAMGNGNGNANGIGNGGEDGTPQKQQQQQLHQQQAVNTRTSSSRTSWANSKQYANDLSRRNSIRRPCYFSPVQCLLVTPGQHRAFENHPEFNDHFGPIIKGTEADDDDGTGGATRHIFLNENWVAVAQSEQQHRRQQQARGVVQKQHHNHRRHHRRRHPLNGAAATGEQKRDGNAHVDREKRKKSGGRSMRRHPIFGNPFRIGL